MEENNEESKFNEEDIDTILLRRTTTITLEVNRLSCTCRLSLQLVFLLKYWVFHALLLFHVRFSLAPDVAPILHFIHSCFYF